MNGDFLLHKDSWTTIMKNYVRYIQNHYSSNYVIVFDGYESKPTKESKRNRRASLIASADIYFNKIMPLKIGQNKLLPNTKNQINII